MIESRYTIDVDASVQDELTLSALFGAIDDLAEEFTSETEERRPDEEILTAIQGVFDAAANTYSSEAMTAFELLDQLTLRLGELACNHDHFSSELERFGLLSEDEHQGHHHEHDKSGEAESSKLQQKTKKAKTARRGRFALLMFGN